jgi:hypothetical protein
VVEVVISQEHALSGLLTEQVERALEEGINVDERFFGDARGAQGVAEPGWYTRKRTPTASPEG